MNKYYINPDNIKKFSNLGDTWINQFSFWLKEGKIIYTSTFNQTYKLRPNPTREYFSAYREGVRK